MDLKGNARKRSQSNLRYYAGGTEESDEKSVRIASVLAKTETCDLLTTQKHYNLSQPPRSCSSKYVAGGGSKSSSSKTRRRKGDGGEGGGGGVVEAATAAAS
jgi:hypothetical protein